MKVINKQGELKVRQSGSTVISDIKAGLVIETPTNSEDASIFFSKDAIVINRMQAVVRGTTPSITWTIRFNSDRSATGTEVVVGGTTTTSDTTGDSVTSFDNSSIPAGSWVWCETTAKSGTVNEMAITLFF